MMKLKTLTALGLTLALTVGCLAGCGGTSDTEGSSGGDDAGADSADKTQIALVLPGKKDDVSFNQAMYEGMMEYADAHADEVEVRVVEGIYDVSDIEPTLIEYADSGYDVVIGHGYQFSEPVNTVAQQYPDTYFLLGCGVGYQTNSA